MIFTAAIGVIDGKIEVDKKLLKKHGLAVACLYGQIALAFESAERGGYLVTVKGKKHAIIPAEWIKNETKMSVSTQARHRKTLIDEGYIEYFTGVNSTPYYRITGKLNHEVDAFLLIQDSKYKPVQTRYETMKANDKRLIAMMDPAPVEDAATAPVAAIEPAAAPVEVAATALDPVEDPADSVELVPLDGLNNGGIQNEHRGANQNEHHKGQEHIKAKNNALHIPNMSYSLNTLLPSNKLIKEDIVLARVEKIQPGLQELKEFGIQNLGFTDAELRELTHELIFGIGKEWNGIFNESDAEHAKNATVQKSDKYRVRYFVRCLDNAAKTRDHRDYHAKLNALQEEQRKESVPPVPLYNWLEERDGEPAYEPAAAPVEPDHEPDADRSRDDLEALKMKIRAS